MKNIYTTIASYTMKGALTLALVSPLLAFAQAPEDLNGVIRIGFGLVRGSSGIVIALALLAFFWGLTKYIANAEDSSKKEEGRNVMVWGIIALFVMVSFIGIISIVQETFLDDSEDVVDLQNFGPTQGGGSIIVNPCDGPNPPSPCA